MAGLYAAYHGPDGLHRIATRVHRLTAILAEGLEAGGVEVTTDRFFDTVTVRVPDRAAQVASRARQERINLRVVDDDTIGIALDEATTREVARRAATDIGVANQEGCANARVIYVLSGTDADGIAKANRLAVSQKHFLPSH